MPDAVQGWAAPSGATGGTVSALGDSLSLENTYQMTAKDRATPILFNGQQMTIADAIRWFNALPADQVLQWENRLVDAGLQSASTVGEPQARTDAFNSLLRYTAYDQKNYPGKNLDAMAVLDRLAYENPGAAIDKRGLTSGAKSLKVHVDLANPLDVKQLGDAVANKLIGRDLTPAEAVAITQTIRSQQSSSAAGELSAEQSLASAQAGGGAGGQGGVISTQAPTSAEAATTQYLTAHDPGDVQAHSLLNVFEAIKQKVETDAQGSGPRAASGPMKVI